ncbi:MAG TPA: hypothetical protein VEY08_06220 [Chloroflexia bacterium]|nr:hypothetical protein [Chloroflexia bacterium]
MFIQRKAVRVALAALLGVMSLLALSNGAAWAGGKPTIFNLEFSLDTPLPAGPGNCAFDVVQHTEGNLKVRVFRDDEGNRVRSIQSFPEYGGYYLNTENGKSVPYEAHGPVLRTFNADGTVSDTMPGVVKANLPGQGVVFINAGSLTFTYFLSDPNNGTIEITGGQFDDTTADICPYLQ